MKKKKETRGGARKGAGIRKNPLPENKKRTVKKSYKWTPEERIKIQKAVQLSCKKESAIVREEAMKKVELIINTDGGKLS